MRRLWPRPLGSGSIFFDYDSMASVEIVGRLQEEFGIKITDAEAQKTHAVEDMINLVWSNYVNGQHNKRLQRTGIGMSLIDSLPPRVVVARPRKRNVRYHYNSLKLAPMPQGCFYAIILFLILTIAYRKTRIPKTNSQRVSLIISNFRFPMTSPRESSTEW